MVFALLRCFPSNIAGVNRRLYDTAKMTWTTSSPGMAISKEPGGADKAAPDGETPTGQKKKVVVIGLGMVGIAFM